MTLLGIDTWNVSAADGPAYRVSSTCANPDCRKLAEHAHHIIRRSHLGGRDERNWVEVGGDIVPNLCGLCAACHNLVTGLQGVGHRAVIFLRAHPGEHRFHTWWWCIFDPDGELRTLKGDKLFPVAPLDPHPPTLAHLLDKHDDEGGDDATCPTCGQTRRRRVGTAGPARQRKSWVVRVPDDAEDGAQILDTLVDDLALVLGYDPGPSARYYVIASALYSAQTNRGRFADEVKGVGG